MIIVKPFFKTLAMLLVLALGILYVDYTINSLLGTPKIMVLEYAKEQIFSVFKSY